MGSGFSVQRFRGSEFMVKISTQPAESARCCIVLRPGGELFTFVDIAPNTGASDFNDKNQQENKTGR